MFDHEKLDVYRLAIEFATQAHEGCAKLDGVFRHARDQFIRASMSIPLNIAEGNGKRSIADRKRFFEIARGSAMECAALLDLLARTKGIDAQNATNSKQLLRRIVQILTRMTETSAATVQEQSSVYGSDSFDYDYEHEHDRKSEPEFEPERR